MENLKPLDDNADMETKNRLKNIGINIKNERLKRGISQEVLAEISLSAACAEMLRLNLQ